MSASILVVEDEPAIQELVAYTCSSNGYSVRRAESVSFGPLTIDPARHEVLVEGNPVSMGLSEFKLLSFLVSHPDRVYSRAQLLDNIWGDHVFIEERTVDVHVLRLRKALTPANAQHLVQTVRGLGYRLSMRPEH